jgi:hypothetical protein
MKNLLLSCMIILALSPLSSASAAYQSFDYAAGLSPTEKVDKTQLEGWIVKVDYRQSTFRMLDPRGFERTVTVKPGIIGDYRIGDRVKVSLTPGRPWANVIEKL